NDAPARAHAAAGDDDDGPLHLAEPARVDAATNGVEVFELERLVAACDAFERFAIVEARKLLITLRDFEPHGSVDRDRHLRDAAVFDQRVEMPEQGLRSTDRER